MEFWRNQVRGGGGVRVGGVLSCLYQSIYRVCPDSIKVGPIVGILVSVATPLLPSNVDSREIRGTNVPIRRGHMGVQALTTKYISILFSIGKCCACYSQQPSQSQKTRAL